MGVLAGRRDGHEGTFGVEERGWFDADGTVHRTFDGVSGTGTGNLTGLHGTGSFTAKHGERSFLYTFSYALRTRAMTAAGTAGGRCRPTPRRPC